MPSPLPLPVATLLVLAGLEEVAVAPLPGYPLPLAPVAVFEAYTVDKSVDDAPALSVVVSDDAVEDAKLGLDCIEVDSDSRVDVVVTGRKLP